MTILVFRGNKGEDPKIFFKEYKRTSIGTGLRIIVEWFKFFSEFLEGTTSH